MYACAMEVIDPHTKQHKYARIDAIQCREHMVMIMRNWEEKFFRK